MIAVVAIPAVATTTPAVVTTAVATAADKINK